MAKSPLRLERDGPVLIVGLDRPEKRNALDDATIAALDELFSAPPADARAVLIHATGPNFSAGLDLSEIAERDVHEGVLHSRSWHRCFDKIESGALPVVAVLRGAVVGGGLELAATAPCAGRRSARRSTPFRRAARHLRRRRRLGAVAAADPGVARMMDMMLTGRVYTAEEGATLGFAQYLVDDGQAYAKGAGAGAQDGGQRAADQPTPSSRRCRALPKLTRGSAMSWNR